MKFTCYHTFITIIILNPREQLLIMFLCYTILNRNYKRDIFPTVINALI